MNFHQPPTPLFISLLLGVEKIVLPPIPFISPGTVKSSLDRAPSHCKNTATFHSHCSHTGNTKRVECSAKLHFASDTEVYQTNPSTYTTCHPKTESNSIRQNIIQFVMKSLANRKNPMWRIGDDCWIHRCESFTEYLINFLTVFQ